MKKGLVFLTLFIICLLGVMIVAPGFIDWNRHKPTIIAQLENATGHDYEINGPLEFTILPFPKLLIEGLEISNEDTRLLTLKRLDVQVELMPLIQGNINIQSVSLIDPVIKLAVNKDGEQSWMTPKLNDMMSGKEDASAADEQKNVSELITLGGISIENGLLEYSDARNGTKEIIQNVDLDLTAATLSGPFEVDGSLTARNQNIDLNLKTGRMEKGADTLSVSAAISLPEMNSTVDYSGVVGLNGGADLQGEASVKTPDLNRLLKAFEIADVSYLSKPFETAGIFSYADNVAAYRNLSMSLDGQAANGSLSFAQAQGGSPAILDVSLAATKKVSLDRLLPRKNAKTADKAAVSFLPQSITLPMNIDASIDLGASQLEYNKSSFSDVAAKISKSGKDVTVNASAKAMQKDTVAVEAKIGFGSVSVSENSGSVTYSDPAMNYKASVESTSAQAFAAFITPEQVNTLKPYLSKGLRSSLAGSVQPTKASITAGTASLNETNLNFSGSYGVKASPSGRDVVSVNLETENINLDQWIVSSEKAGPKGKINISDYTKMLDLPFNLSVTALSKRVSFGDAAYQNLQLKAATAGQKLTIDNFSITDSDSNNMLVAGTIDDVVALRDISMSVSGKTNDLEALLKNFDVDTSGFPARVGPAELVSEFRGQSDDLAFTANVKALRGTAEASGTLANMLNTPEVSGLTLRLRHPSYVELARLFKPNFESGVGLKKSLDLFTSMKNENGVYSFSEIKALIGPSTITGDLRADLSGTKPVVKATIQADTLPLDDFMGHKTASKGTTRVTPQTARAQDKWSREPIDMSWLHDFNFDLRATAGTLAYGNWTVKQARLDTVLNNGELKLQEVSGNIYEGSLMMTAELKAPQEANKPISVQGELKIDKVQLEPFVQSFSGSKLVKARGPVSLNTTFGATGSNQAELIFDLRGDGTMKGEALTFEGFDLARLSRALAEPTSSFSKNFGRVLDATTSGGTTNFDTLDSVFDIKSGVANITSLDLKGPEASVNGTGNINLPLWTIDLETNVVLTEPEDAPVLKTVFKGPLDNPGSTFGQNALNQYFNKQIEGLVLNPLLDSLQKKGILPTAPQKQTPQPTNDQSQIIQPDAVPQPEPSNDNQSNIQNEQSSQTTEPAPQAQQPAREPTPEEAIFGIIRGVLEQ